jgi:hypothetical protein
MTGIRGRFSSENPKCFIVGDGSLARQPDRHIVWTFGRPVKHDDLWRLERSGGHRNGVNHSRVKFVRVRDQSQDRQTDRSYDSAERAGESGQGDPMNGNKDTKSDNGEFERQD